MDNTLVYAGAALPGLAAIHIELARDNRVPNQGMLASATAQDIRGKSVNMQDAAQKVGFDHFNWLQIIVSDVQLQACAANMSLPGCAGLATITGKVPTLPSVDPPLGGYAYELCPTGPGCQSSFPVQDFLDTYWDEYFSPVPDSDVWYVAKIPSSPEYLTKYRQERRLAKEMGPGVIPRRALGFSFSDMPTSDFVDPGTGQNEKVKFVTALVGVTGSCVLVGSRNCAFQIFPGTTFKWTSTSGSVRFRSSPGTFARMIVGDVERRRAKHPDDFPSDPIDLTGEELSGAIISIDEFLSQGNLTTQSLAAMGGGISIFSGSLVPPQAAALAAVAAGGTLVASSEVSTTGSGLAYSRVTQTFNGTVSITNISGSAIAGPLQIVFNEVPVSVTMVNATGNFSGTPYLTVPIGSLGPGQSVVANVQFRNPSNAEITLAPTIYSGSLH